MDGKLYGVPFVWGANAIGFNRKETGDIDSLAALFDPLPLKELARYDQEPEYLDTAAYARSLQALVRRERQLLARLGLARAS